MAVYNDFIGFSFQPIINGVPQEEIHSSDLNILRVSDGSRYSENLLPTMKDQTAEIPGGDGMYWWETNNTQRNFTINIAFASVTESNRRKIMKLFDGRNLGYLVFDEMPFKRYTVKSTGTPNIKFICFEENEQRIYKGEGTLTFVAYYPYAISVEKYLDNFVGNRYANKSKWAAASGMKATQGSYDGTGTSVTVYNAGDIECPIKLFFNSGNLSSISMGNNYGMLFTPFSLENGDTKFCIDSSTHLIEGYNDNNQKTGNLYNKYIKSGDFFLIPNDGQNYTITTDGAAIQNVEYQYIYF